jgi:hypothetical protein
MGHPADGVARRTFAVFEAASKRLRTPAAGGGPRLAAGATALRENRALGAPTDDLLDPSPFGFWLGRHTNGRGEGNFNTRINFRGEGDFNRRMKRKGNYRIGVIRLTFARANWAFWSSASEGVAGRGPLGA